MKLSQSLLRWSESPSAQKLLALSGPLCLVILRKSQAGNYCISCRTP